MSDHETWVDADHANTLNAFDVGDTRTTHAIVANGSAIPQIASTLQGSSKGSRGWRNDAEGMAGGHIVPDHMSVRRLTPVECERLQGFPDNYTDIKLKGKPTPDGPRYKALGNSMAVPVMAWIGKRIQEVEAINAP